MASLITTVNTPIFFNLVRLSNNRITKSRTTIIMRSTISFSSSSSILPSLSSYGFASHVPTLETKKKKGWMMVTRAGPSTNSLLLAFFLPLSLILVTIFTSIRIADKLDQDFLEELAINEAVMEGDDEYKDEDEDEDDNSPTLTGEKSALPRVRNRPKREA